MAQETINLHAITAEIVKVQEQLREARLQASPGDLEYLDLKIAELDDLRRATARLCPKVQGVWGEVASLELPPQHATPSRPETRD